MNRSTRHVLLHVGQGDGCESVQAAAADRFAFDSCRPAEAEARVRELAPDIIVMGSETPDTLTLAQALRHAAPQAELLFRVPSDQLERFRAMLPFVPKLASALTIEAESPPTVLQELLARASRAVEARVLRVNLSAALRRRNEPASHSEDSDARLRQLTISQDYLATLLAQAPDAFIAISATGEILAWNAAAIAMFGHNVDAVLGKHYDEVLPRSIAELIRPNLQRVAASDIVRDLEGNFTLASGKPCFVACRMAPVRDPVGDLASISVSLRDVSDRRAVEARLRDSELRYRTLAETLPQLVWTCLPDGRCDFLGQQWVDYTGIPEQDQLGLAWLDLVVHPDDRDRTRKHWLGAVAGVHPYDIEYRIRRHDGIYRWFKTRGTPLRNTSGEIVHWFGTCTDIEDVVQAREVLARSAEELEARITAEIAKRTKAEESLRQAQKMEAIGQLTGGLAHDFNNLLQGIIGALDLIAKRVAENRPDEVLRFAEAARTSANRAAGLTHRLLAFSRRQPLAPKPTWPAVLARGMEELLRRSIGEHIELEFRLAHETWMTLCDPVQLETAILNLALNARDAMPHGGTLTIATCNVELKAGDPLIGPEMSGGPYVCISVSDTGVGMPADVMARAFDPFFTTKPTGQGTGLGLSMVYGFARQSDGQVALESTVGLGTSVKLLLPRYTGPALKTEAASLPVIKPSPLGESVLVVEDEPMVRSLIIDTLSELHYRVLAAEDGPSGLKVLESSEPIDLLLTDIGLPGLNGRQLADAARVRRPELRILFMTGYAEKATLGSGVLERGMSLITKPFTMGALAVKVREILEAEGAGIAPNQT